MIEPVEWWGVWNSIQKKFQFGIREPSKAKALEKLRGRIGHDSHKYRFSIRKIGRDVKNELA